MNYGIYKYSKINNLQKLFVLIVSIVFEYFDFGAILDMYFDVLGVCCTINRYFEYRMRILCIFYIWVHTLNVFLKMCSSICSKRSQRRHQPLRPHAYGRTLIVWSPFVFGSGVFTKLFQADGPSPNMQHALYNFLSWMHRFIQFHEVGGMRR